MKPKQITLPQSCIRAGSFFPPKWMTLTIEGEEAIESFKRQMGFIRNPRPKSAKATRKGGK